MEHNGGIESTHHKHKNEQEKKEKKKKKGEKAATKQTSNKQPNPHTQYTPETTTQGRTKKAERKGLTEDRKKRGEEEKKGFDTQTLQNQESQEPSNAGVVYSRLLPSWRKKGKIERLFGDREKKT